jgi:hypothetical protein
MNTDSLNPITLEKRTWVYVQRAAQYEVAGCSCGNLDPDWSEYKDRLWCSACQIDFQPEHWGVFDGPICVGACAMLGICFDRFNLETQQIERFDEA